MKPVIENEPKRKRSRERGWVEIIADQFGGMLGDTTKKIKERKKKTRDI